MKITQLSYSYKTTIQMRQFEPTEISAFAMAQVDPGDNAQVVMNKLRDLVHETVKRNRKNNNAWIQQVMNTVWRKHNDISTHSKYQPI